MRAVRSMYAFGGMTLGLWLASGLAAAATEELVPNLSSDVTVEDVRSDPLAVHGRIINETGDQLENVRLVITDQFLWRNEFHPGEDSPGDAHVVVVPGPIPPHGTATFAFQRPSPLPDRPEGDFTTEVSATEVTLRPVTGYYPSERSVSPGRSSASTISR
jgi:hypothetical protein